MTTENREFLGLIKTVAKNEERLAGVLERVEIWQRSNQEQHAAIMKQLGENQAQFAAHEKKEFRRQIVLAVVVLAIVVASTGGDIGGIVALIAKLL